MLRFDTLIAQKRDYKALYCHSGRSDHKRNTKYFFMTRQHPVGQDLFIIDAWRLHANPQPSLRLLWTSDQPDAETSTWQDSIHKGQKSMTPAETESAIRTSEKSDT